MKSTMRGLDAIGSIILDFETKQKIVGLWATQRDPFSCAFGEAAPSYSFTMKEIKTPLVPYQDGHKPAE
jgi:hypothetical protein